MTGSGKISLLIVKFLSLVRLGKFTDVVTGDCGDILKEHDNLYCDENGNPICIDGWRGSNCNYCITKFGCKKGYCNTPYECICEDGWVGELCDKPECINCVHGFCYEPYKCICEVGWNGISCEECVAHPSCQNGECIDSPARCDCRPGWTGLGCSIPICKESCDLSHAFCNDPEECICLRGWKGKNCNECTPFPGCTGTCVDDKPWTCSDLDEVLITELQGNWSSWGEWSKCSKSCGGGIQQRHRVCPGLEGRSENCRGQYFELRKCVYSHCEVDGSWSRWSQWSKCSVTCGTGSSVRNRSCSNPQPQYGGRDCIGQLSQASQCYLSYCPEPSVWSEWSQWSNCDKTCGEDSVRTRKRQCRGSMDCLGQGVDVKTCKSFSCPTVGEWGLWSICQSGDTTTTRMRECLNSGCYSEELIEFRECGLWGEWSNWSSCSISCVRTKNRICSIEGDCDGKSSEQVICTEDPCSRESIHIGEWAHWSLCSVTCGEGAIHRERLCLYSSTVNNYCNMSLSETHPCFMSNCPVTKAPTQKNVGNSPAIWTEWSSWTTCSSSCGGGLRSRERVCKDSRACSGLYYEEKPCNEESCFYGPWGFWSQCSATCGQGKTTRDRICLIATEGSDYCKSGLREEMPCIDVKCPIDGEFTDWGSWSPCSVPCFGDMGFQIRRRHCLNPRPMYGGKICEGIKKQKRFCTGVIPKQSVNPFGICFNVGY